MRRLLVLLGCCIGLAMLSSPSYADTVKVVDLAGGVVYPAFGTSCPGSPSGSVIKLGDCFGMGGFLNPDSSSPEQFVFLFSFISPQYLPAYDRVYLSVTEGRTGPNLNGTANVYAASSAVVAPTSISSTIDNTLAGGIIPAGTLTGTGVGGNRLLLDVTGAVQTSLTDGVNFFGFLLLDQPGDGAALGILGANVSSRLLGGSSLPICGTVPDGKECQYWAKSGYEYPTLMFTSGSDLTPMSDLSPERPLPGPPTPISEPPTFVLLGSGLIGLTLFRRL